ncbi:MAG: hypothetical protein ACLUGV_10770 [Alistipes shahii]
MKRILLLLLVLGAVCSLNAKTRKCLYRVTVTGKRAECPVVIRDVPEWAQSAVVRSAAFTGFLPAGPGTGRTGLRL